ncbi:type I-E CRISPR-associated protein Cas5/CasD [uncultured Megasphaera sp.]|uniref:type I-E CRISPR-associated protein Cas5/CasD n=2 Tax=uncultured Megasphaera sp. TaxID=165188 RepID=UPI00259533F6|nr:type I-E CRISPR-associated protein Cas5/CasD [uncultured Megasphaera sp.]
MKTILLKLAGPLQSWGTNSHFEYRRTDNYPSKSAIIGMILAAMGIRRGVDENLIIELNKFDFALRIDQEGDILEDYHIVQNRLKEASFYVTKRYYLEDAVFLAALGSENGAVIAEIEHALKYPHFQPFMGRRSCPVPADFFLGVFEEGVIEILKTYPWQAASWFKKKQRHDPKYHTFVYADSHLLKQAVRKRRKDKVASFSQKNRQFQYRFESELSVMLENPLYQGSTKDEHDALAAIGGEYVSIQSKSR